MKRWFIPAVARARGQSNEFNREIPASNFFDCRKEVINAPPVPSISRCIHIVYRHKNVWEYQWSNVIYNCMTTFLHYVHCKDALLDCSAPGGERCESLTWVDEIIITALWEPLLYLELWSWRFGQNCHLINSLISEYMLDKTIMITTRSTPRAQTSAAPGVKSVKQSIHAWNSAPYCSLCPYPENFINIHPSVIPWCCQQIRTHKIEKGFLYPMG